MTTGTPGIEPPTCVLLKGTSPPSASSPRTKPPRYHILSHPPPTPPSQPSALRASGTTQAPAWPSRLPPRLLHTAAVYGPRGLRPLVYAVPLPPRFARAVLHPRYARARPAPSASWSAMSTAPRRVRPQGSRRHYVPSRILAKTRTTFRYVIRQPTLSASSRLRRSLNPVPASASGLCHRTCLKPSSAPSPPALPPRNPH